MFCSIACPPASVNSCAGFPFSVCTKKNSGGRKNSNSQCAVFALRAKERRIILPFKFDGLASGFVKYQIAAKLQTVRGL